MRRRTAPPLLPAALAAIVMVLSTSSPGAAGATGAEDARSAASDLAECDRRVAAQPESWESSCLYRAARAGGRWEEAAHLLAVHLARSPGNPWLQFNLGRIELDHPLEGAGSSGADQGHRRAERLFTAAAAGFAARGEREGEIYARLNVATCRERAGRAAAAAPELERAAAVAQNLANRPLLAQVRIHHARAMAIAGRDLDRAERLLYEIEPIVFRGGPFPPQADWLLALGNVEYGLGRLDRALAAYRSLARRARAAGDAFVEATARYQIAVAQTARLPTPAVRIETLRLAREALATARAGGHPVAEARSLLLLAKLEGEPRAAAYLDRSAVLARGLHEPETLSSYLGTRAASLIAKDPAAAARHLDEALTVARQADDPWTAIYLWAPRLRVRFATLPRAAALADGNAVLDAVEALRDLQPEGGGRARLFSNWTEIYAWLSGRLLAGPAEAATPGPPRTDIERAFALTERMRARVLLEELRLSGVDKISKVARPVGAHPAFAPLPAVEAALGDDEALLSYQVALWRDVYGDFAGGSWLLAVTRRGTRVYRLPDRVRLEPALDVYQGLLEAPPDDTRDGTEAEPAAHLYQELLGPAIADLPKNVRHLIVVPDGALYRLPFASLRESPGAPPLPARFRLSIVPSATLWLRWRRRRPPPPTAAALVLADPDLAKGPAGPAARLAKAQGLGPLPGARREGRTLLRHLGGSPSRLFAGTAASEQLLASTPLDHYGLLHLAAHAVLDDERPERSAVLLAPGDRGDGLLEPREIANLHLGGRLVILAACRSAAGELLEGEGVMSLARAFFQGGAGAVVASLWPLRDQDSAALFDRFYFHLAQGETTAAALAAAQLDRHRAGAPASAWAGVVLLGDGDTSPLPSGPRRPLAGPSASLLLSLALLAVIVLVLLIWRRTGQ